MKIELAEVGERLVARPVGRMEASDGEHFAQAIGEAVRPPVGGVTIDLDQLDFINFGAIRALLRLARKLKSERLDLDFIGGGIAVRDALDQAGFDDFFPFTPPYVQRGKRNGTQ